MPLERTPAPQSRHHLRFGVSACLLGDSVRWDGGHRLQPALLECFDGVVAWIPVCPEVEVGMGVPRETIQIHLRGSEFKLVASQSARDWTSAMQTYLERLEVQLSSLDLDAYVLKSKSPSCGLRSVKIYADRGDQVLREDGDGFLVRMLLQRMPQLPLVEETELLDPAQRQSFLERARRYRDSKRAPLVE